MLTLIAKFLNILNSDAAPSHIAMAISLALIAGMNSIFSVFGIVVIFLIFIFRVNLSAFIVMYGVFAGLTFVLGAPIAALGDAVLMSSKLQGLWQDWYQSPIFRYAQLHHSLIMGQLVASLILFIPLFLFVVVAVTKYRQSMKTFVEKFKVVQSLKASKFYQAYQTVKLS